MEAWLIDHFPLYTDGTVIVFTDRLNFATYNPANASTDFSGIVSPPTYVALSALPLAQGGWQKIFDQWKANGLVS